MIQSVKKSYGVYNEFNSYKVIFVDGTISFVPLDEENRHYQEILEWVAAGNTITDPGE